MYFTTVITKFTCCGCEQTIGSCLHSLSNCKGCFHNVILYQQSFVKKLSLLKCFLSTGTEGLYLYNIQHLMINFSNYQHYETTAYEVYVNHCSASIFYYSSLYALPKFLYQVKDSQYKHCTVLLWTKCSSCTHCCIDVMQIFSITTYLNEFFSNTVQMFGVIVFGG